MKYRFHLLGCFLLALIFSTWLAGADKKRGLLMNPFKKINMKAENKLSLPDFKVFSDTYGDMAYTFLNSVSVAAPPPPKVEFDPMTELVCFDTNLPAKLAIYTERYGTDKPGHAFISLAQGQDTVVYGFYPAKNFPRSFRGPGVLGNDSGHYYDHAWDLGEISGEQLAQILEISKVYGKIKYIFLTRNCVDFVIEIMWIKGLDVNNSWISATTNLDKLIRPFATSWRSYAPRMNKSCIEDEPSPPEIEKIEELNLEEEASEVYEDVRDYTE